MDGSEKTELAERLTLARPLADGVAAALKESHDALWSGDARRAFVAADRARRLALRLAEACGDAGGGVTPS
jgi:hypothetical protein